MLWANDQFLYHYLQFLFCFELYLPKDLPNAAVLLFTANSTVPSSVCNTAASHCVLLAKADNWPADFFKQFLKPHLNEYPLNKCCFYHPLKRDVESQGLIFPVLHL